MSQSIVNTIPIKKLKIGILGTRGIPNAYGGFEQFAQYLSVGLVEKGHNVWVYNSHLHPYKLSEWNGVNIIHCKDLENRLGTAGQFIYDYNCIKDARTRKFDILLQLGYTSNSIWYHFWPKTINIVNMDGLEWKRTKYGSATKKFLKVAEKLAAKHADILIADSIGIQKYLKSTYNKESEYIPYGATSYTSEESNGLLKFQLQPKTYALVMARMEPENNIEMVIKGFMHSARNIDLVIIGNTSNKYGTYLTRTYKNEKIKFIGAIYDINIVNALRFNSLIYFHGHSVGGTNPSLLEAMASKCNIAAHRNDFNEAILNENAHYFSSSDEVSSILRMDHNTLQIKQWIEENIQKINSTYSWNTIINAYESVFHTVLAKYP